MSQSPDTYLNRVLLYVAKAGLYLSETICFQYILESIVYSYSYHVSLIQTRSLLN